ncbi:transcriptional regulator [Virgibacillus profundi]|uniref:Transcriptional regulator n=1 Tax=Virgibacillus profundi TaxID=2024555 RepID=A0A2A2IAN3_9BACI|nr:helix-turn-helix transcriptional regulator [Virgibacillus profundi]PAV28448.1 transcriptional regulator [Virgibacillus profundi]PXY52621.1 XRE family transcriptional regulator [Virgibacillus profundi]
MTFGEKLFKIRKEKGLSQEALAEKLNTTRQAISKWENGQGYPETEKLLMIGNIFEISMDYLLKDTVRLSNDSEEGYYVSKEMGDGYLLNQHKVAKYVALGLFLIALSIVPYFFFKQDPVMYLLPTIIIATIGFGVSVSAGFLEEDQYKILKQEPLLFDENYLKELTVRYEVMKKRYGAVLIIGICLFVAGLLGFGLDRKYITSSEFLVPYYPIFVILIAVGIYILVRTSTAIDGLKLLAKNEEYTNRISFKLRKKVRKKVDGF